MSQNPSQVPNHSPSFRLVREQRIDSLNINVQEFEHINTGAQHIHLSAKEGKGNGENVFLVALRTVPQDSRGVAHILEHTALCGSEKYPVRDPFFMMTRRSINTFMNAFTSSDWTAYPFASLNKKDFNNLLDVYLDAVFFSRLDELDFAQEGHRLEFKEASDATSPLEYKGVVYNEMKGAMSSVTSQLWQTMSKYLFPTSTYHFNSGGEPEDIPDLSYDQLLSFYKTHYHPSNAIFMTYGDISAEDHQNKFETQVLSRFERLDYKVSVADEKRYHAPIKVQEHYPNNDDDISEKTHVVEGWLLGNSTNLRDSLRAQLLSSVLLDNSASPLMHALESSDLGAAPSPLCGLDDSQKELTFLCGLAGCKPESGEAVKQLITQTLETFAEQGIPQKEVESALHQLELHQREVGGDSYPYGLQLILTALTNATHRGDPIGLLNIDSELAQLRKDVQSEDFIKNLTKDLLLNNQHRVHLTMVPDGDLSERKEAAEKQKLQSIKDSLSDSETQEIINQAENLKTRQAAIDDDSILPKVTLSDVPKEEVNINGSRQTLKSTEKSKADNTVIAYGAGTNGIVYQQAIFEIPALPQHLIALLPLYGSIVTEMGANSDSYLDMQRRQASVCGSFSGFSSIRGTINDNNQTNNFFTFSGKALDRNQADLCSLMTDTIQGVRFDELSRIDELVSQIKTHQEQSVTGSGHVLAMTAASSGTCAAARLSHQLSGLAGIQSIKRLYQSIKNDGGLETLAENLGQLHQRITQSTPQLLLVGEDAKLPGFIENLSQFQQLPNQVFSDRFSLEQHKEQVQDAWLTSTQVNFCAKSFPTVSMDHEDAAPLVILGGFLRNGFLHTAIREQGGAYGGGASQDNNTGAFRFYSYRDPRLAETLEDFDQARQWLLEKSAGDAQSSQQVEEAILGTVSSLDRSESPAGGAKRCFHADLHGRTIEKRQQFRERVLNTTFADIQSVAERYLAPEQASTAVITGANQRAEVEKLSLNITEL